MLEAVKNADSGILTLDVLDSLGLCNKPTMRTTISRLNKKGRILRLKRGVYSTNPIKDAFSAAQEAFNGYIGFSSALYVHKLIAELPFSITVVTTSRSSSKRFGSYEFKAVALKERAVGFETVGKLVVSTKAKTLFDCIYLQRYSIEMAKLIDAYKTNQMTRKEWDEFNGYVSRFVHPERRHNFEEVKKRIMAKGDYYGA